MKGEERQISIDQFYADKINNSEINLDVSAAWEQFEIYEKQKGSFIYKVWGAIVSTLILGTLSIWLFVFNNSDTAKHTFNEEIFSANQNNPGDHDKSKKVFSLESDTQDAANELTEPKSSIVHENSNDSTFKPGSGIEGVENSKSTGNTDGLARHSSKTSPSKKSNYQGPMENTNMDFSPFLKQGEKEGQINDDFKAEQKANFPFGKSSAFHEDGRLKSGNAWEEAGNILLPTANVGRYELRNRIDIQLLLNRYAVLMSTEKLDFDFPAVVRPKNLDRNSKWSIDIGLTYGREYELDESFNLNESGGKIRLSHIALNYKHLQSRLFETHAYLSFDKVYGEKEFVGERIVRTYRDDNFALGYGLKWNLTSRLSLESSISAGISLIDKVEFEQKPTYIDGMQIYKDYTETAFEMKPTTSFQNHTKLSYALSSKLNMFAGTVYRSQFANRLSSNESARENTLSKFSDLQLLIGLRYCL